MANVQKEHGHAPIANKLLTAIFQRCTSSRWLRVILWTIRNSYGWNRKWAPDLGPREMGRQIGMDHANIIKTVVGLVRAGILRREGERFYLVKDYEAWISTPGDNSVDNERWQNNTGGKTTPIVVAKQHQTGVDIYKVVKAKNKAICSSPEFFDLFWTAYPRKSVKVAAIRSWKSLKPDLALVETILKSVKAWSETDQWLEDKKYIPHPATFLNQRRWEDEAPERSKKFRVEDSASLRRRKEAADERMRKTREYHEKKMGY